MLVNRYGHISTRINDDYYGLGVQRPVRGAWKLRVKEPGWFSKKLYLVFEQTTKEKYEDYNHGAICTWNGDGDLFDFTIRHHTYQAAIICYRYASDPEHICP